MSIVRGIRKAASGPGAALGGVLTPSSVYGLDGFLDVENISLSREKAMKLSTVNRCVEVRSCTMAALPVYLMREDTKERLRQHRLSRVLWGRHNEAMTRFDYERLMQVNLDLSGNAYAWISRDPRTGYPVELIPLQPDHVTPYVALDSSLWYIYTNPRTGQMYRLDNADVLHYKGYSLDGIEGVSILHRAALTIKTGLAAQEYQRSMYRNGGRPSGVLTTDTDIGGKIKVKKDDGTTEEISKKEHIRREWEKIHAGPDKGFRVAVMDNGLKYQAISVSNADAQFVESEDVRVADVCRFFGTPLHMVYAGKQAYSSNEQNAIEFSRFTLQPLVIQREQEDSYKLLLPRERTEELLRIRREMKGLLRGDTAAQAAWYKAMREVSAYSPNDILALEDMPAVEGGDSRYASLNYVPLADFQELSIARNGGAERAGAGAPVPEA